MSVPGETNGQTIASEQGLHSKQNKRFSPILSMCFCTMQIHGRHSWAKEIHGGGEDFHLSIQQKGFFFSCTLFSFLFNGRGKEKKGIIRDKEEICCTMLGQQTFLYSAPGLPWHMQHQHWQSNESKQPMQAWLGTQGSIGTAHAVVEALKTAGQS